MICETCGDIIRIADWTQLTLDDNHELFFTLSECQCGTKIMEAKAVTHATNDSQPRHG